MSQTFPEAPAAAVYPSALPPAVGAHSAHGPRLNTSVVVIVVILCVVLLLSGLLHLLARCLGRRRRHRGSSVRVPEHSPLVSVLHGQLQHLFHLHDAGVEQAFIDTLPVFSYGSIRGLKDSTDCAVCLTEFGDEDRLRLLPKCKHAFHLECIDTWLLSNSTCPLCRRSLLPDPSHLHNASSSRRCHSEPLLEDHDDDEADASSSSSQILAHPNNNRIPTIASIHGSLHGSYQNSFRICDAGASSDHDDSDQNEIQEIHETQETQVTQELHEIQEIQEIHEIEEFHEVEDESQGDVDLLQTPSPFAPTIRVTDIHGTPRVLKVELGRVASRAQSETRKLTTAGARSYSMGSYEYIVDPASWELRMAPTPYPGRPQDWAPSKPTHRSALSDSIPELASAGVTPANDELFWASRGLYNPHTLSRVRELLTPIGSEGFSPFMEFAYSPGYGDRWIDIDIERGEIVESEGSFRCQEEREIKQRSSSLSRLPASPKLSVTLFRRSFSETSLGMEQAVSALLVDGGAGTPGCEETRKGTATSSDAALDCDETLRRQGSFSRRFSLNWLMGRDKRMVFAAASPVTVSDSPQPISI